MKMNEDFKKELTSLLNRYSWDNACETPDYILADYVESCLKNLCGTIAEDIAWHIGWKRLGEDINTFHKEEKTEERNCKNCGKTSCKNYNCDLPFTCGSYREKQ